MSYTALVVCFIAALIITPFITKFAFKIGAVDQPNNRKVHSKIMPRIGGLAIYTSFLVGLFFYFPDSDVIWPIMAGSLIIIITGFLDDMLQLSAKIKLVGQVLAAIVTVLGGIRIDFITLPFLDRVEFGLFAIPITVIWIVAVTNAINLIDGLDGLAAGVSSIALLTIALLAISMGDTVSALIGLMLFGSTLGFLFYNFYPAKIFMGDTGSLFLGYMIGVLAVNGLYKEATLFSLIVPIIILAIPILDTMFAIIRRIVHQQPISAPDKFHLHHCIIRLGFTHRQTVIMIYAMSSLFSIAAVIFTQSTLWGATAIIISLIILVELLVEITGLVSNNYRPLLRLMEGSKFKK